MKILIYLAILFFAGDFFSLTLPASDGPAIELSQFRGKNILVVNIATSSPGIVQAEQLESLYQKYKDNLVIIAIPSNSFGKEPMNDEELKTFFSTAYHPHFIITAKSEVTGENAASVYKWLMDPVQNGLMSVTITENYQKILINGEGKIIGLFAGTEDPMSEAIQNAISTSN